MKKWRDAKGLLAMVALLDILFVVSLVMLVTSWPRTLPALALSESTDFGSLEQGAEVYVKGNSYMVLKHLDSYFTGDSRIVTKKHRTDWWLIQFGENQLVVCTEDDTSEALADKRTPTLGGVLGGPAQMLENRSFATELTLECKDVNYGDWGITALWFSNCALSVLCLHLVTKDWRKGIKKGAAAHA